MLKKEKGLEMTQIQIDLAAANLALRIVKELLRDDPEAYEVVRNSLVEFYAKKGITID